MSTNLTPLSESEILFNQLKEIADELANRYDFKCDDGDIETAVMAFDSIINNTEAFTAIFKKLYSQSLEDNFYWRHCPFQVYKKTLPARLARFMEVAIDALPEDFYYRELLSFFPENSSRKQTLFELKNSKDLSGVVPIEFTAIDFLSKFDHKNIPLPLDEEFGIALEITQTRKIEYIEGLLSQGFDLVPSSGYTCDQSDFRELFVGKGFELFCYLNKNYTTDDNSPKAKYSYIYHFLKSKDYIIGRVQSKYLECIQKYMEVESSKIQPTNYKYDNEISRKLAGLEINFKQQKLS